MPFSTSAFSTKSDALFLLCVSAGAVCMENCHLLLGRSLIYCSCSCSSVAISYALPLLCAWRAFAVCAIRAVLCPRKCFPMFIVRRLITLYILICNAREVTLLLFAFCHGLPKVGVPLLWM